MGYTVISANKKTFLSDKFMYITATTPPDTSEKLIYSDTSLKGKYLPVSASIVNASNLYLIPSVTEYLGVNSAGIVMKISNASWGNKAVGILLCRTEP